jgi:hypothetical protein
MKAKAIYFGKLKEVHELYRVSPSIPSLTIGLLNGLRSPTGFIRMYSTYNPEVWVTTDGTTVPIEAFERIEESLCLDDSKPSTIILPKGSAVEATEHLKVTQLHVEDSTPETAESTLEDTLSDYTPEVIKEPEEAHRVSNEPLVMSKTLFSKSTVMKHRTHYVKLQLKEADLSFRYFFEAEDNKHLEGHWWLVDHGRKQQIKVDTDFIKKYYEDIIEMLEIIGRHLPKRGYYKIIKDIKTGELVERKE